MMMNIKIASYLLLFAAFSSCGALKTLSSHDNNTTTASSTNGNSAPSFIDNISVTPGASGEKPNVVKGRKGNDVATTEPPKRIKAVNLKPGETNPAVLQMKYSALLDVNADKLTNVALLQNIDHWWGTQYCLGGSTEDCIDCSGFTQTIMRDVYALNVPRTAGDQYDSTQRIDDNQLAEGDLVFFHTTGRGHSITHVGVYITNNHFAHASTTGGVTISTLDDPYWKPKYVAAGRVKRV